MKLNEYAEGPPEDGDGQVHFENELIKGRE